MSLYQGLLGAQVELAALPPTARLQRAAAIAKLFASELAGTVALAPYALRAATLHRTLPSPDPNADASHVTLERGVRYGSAPRAVADVYVPPSSSSSSSPCVVFVHGGVWAAGEAFHYAPLATSLARLGVLTYVITYTLYPDALVPALVGETAAALAFAMDDAPRRGGDPNRVALVGHSAGAHLAAMALLYKAAAAAGVKAGAAAARAAARAEAAERQGGWGAGEGEGEGASAAIVAAKDEDEDDDEDDPPSTVDELLLHPSIRDPRMPSLFVGCAGMYDAAKHYDFERCRGVHELSTLKRAMGGAERFAAMSPSAILGAATARAAAVSAGAGEGRLQAQSPAALGALDATRFYETPTGGGGGFGGGDSDTGAPTRPPPTPWQLAGEAIAHRVGLDRESSGYAARDAQLAGELALAGMLDVLPFPVVASAGAAAAEGDSTSSTVAPAAAASLLPPTVLMHAIGDVTVPFDESTELHRRLLDAGATAGSKALLYRGKGIGHASFVLDWPAGTKSRRWLRVDDVGGGGAPGEWAGEGDGSGGDGAAAWEGDGGGGGGGGAGAAAEQGQQQQDADFWDLVAELPPHCRDLALIVTGRAEIDFCKPSVAAAEVAAGRAAAVAVSAAARARSPFFFESSSVGNKTHENSH
jgi:acetyl esterase/lipase